MEGITRAKRPSRLPLVLTLSDAGYGIRTVQELLGHQDVAATPIYTHLLNKPGVAVKSPLDRMSLSLPQ